MCRWITVDPIGFEGGSNLYTFLNNNPLNLADFYGLYPEKFSDLHFSLEEDMNHFDEGIFARGFGVGAWKGFSDFTGALNNQANLITGFGQMCYNRDFSSLSFGSLDVKNTVGFLGERTGEIAGQVAFMASAVGPIYQLGKLGLQRFVLPNLSRGVTSAFGSLAEKENIGLLGGIAEKGFLKNVSQTNLTPVRFFGAKTFEEVEILLTNKFGFPRPGAPGGKSFFNQKTKRTFHLHKHPDHMNGRPHVDIRRRGRFQERQYYLRDE
jgi:hypothetical protein